MASRFGGFGVRSLAALDESGKGLNNRRLDGLGNKTSAENLDGGSNVLDEAKALVMVTNKAIESLNDGVHTKEFEGMDGSANQVAKMMVWNNDFMLDMVATDLDWKFGRVSNGSQSGRGLSFVGNLNPWRETVGKATKKHGIHINGVNRGLNLANPACPRGVNFLRGGQGSNANEMAYLKSLGNTFSPDGVLDFIKFAAKHPTRTRTSFVEEKQAELTAYNIWRGCFPPTFKEGEISADEEVNKAQSNRKETAKKKKKRSSS